MLERIYSDERTILRHREAIFGPHIDAFVEARGSMQYAVQSLRNDLSHIGRFGAFLRAAGKSGVGQVTAEDLHTYVEGYVRRTGATAKDALAARRSVRALFDYLTATKVLDRSPLDISSKPKDRWDDLLKSYLWFLQHHRGLSVSTRRSRETWGRALFDHLRNELGDAPLSAITIAVIDAFVLERAAAVSRACQHQLVQTVRSLLRYLQQEGKICSDLAALVAAPRRYADAALPSGLDGDQAARVLRAVDRGTPMGARDHAMLTLLAVYGLRASEVASLRLEDVDWRTDQVRVAQSKGRRRLLLPLVTEAGDAILSYLRGGRPTSRHREIFVRHQAPYSPVKSSAVYRIVRKAIDRAGVETVRRGPHVFRHGRATTWIRGGWSLKAIGDLLGHRSEDTTRVYCKLAIEDLRSVALDAPEIGG